MRFPVFAKHSNPAIDRPILKKKHAYIQALLISGRAYLVNSDNPALGVILLSSKALEPDTLNFAAGSGFDSAWSMRQSGYAGPLVWQLA